MPLTPNSRINKSFTRCFQKLAENLVAAKFRRAVLNMPFSATTDDNCQFHPVCRKATQLPDVFFAIPRNLAFIDLIDLRRIQELFRILEINLLTHEGIE